MGCESHPQAGRAAEVNSLNDGGATGPSPVLCSHFSGQAVLVPIGCLWDMLEEGPWCPNRAGCCNSVMFPFLKKKNYYYGWFTMFCPFLLYSKVTQSYIHIHSFSTLSSIMFHCTWWDIVPCAIRQDLTDVPLKKKSIFHPYFVVSEYWFITMGFKAWAGLEF